MNLVPSECWLLEGCFGGGAGSIRLLCSKRNQKKKASSSVKFQDKTWTLCGLTAASTSLTRIQDAHTQRTVATGQATHPQASMKSRTKALLGRARPACHSQLRWPVPTLHKVPLTSYVFTIFFVTAKMGWMLLSESLCASWPTDG